MGGQECCGDPGDCGDYACGSAVVRNRQAVPVSGGVHGACYCATLSRVHHPIACEPQSGLQHLGGDMPLPLALWICWYAFMMGMVDHRTRGPAFPYSH